MGKVIKLIKIVSTVDKEISVLLFGLIGVD